MCGRCRPLHLLMKCHAVLLVLNDDVTSCKCLTGSQTCTVTLTLVPCIPAAGVLYVCNISADDVTDLIDRYASAPTAVYSHRCMLVQMMTMATVVGGDKSFEIYLLCALSNSHSDAPDD